MEATQTPVKYSPLTAEEFYALPQAEKRVQIAKDVILQLDLAARGEQAKIKLDQAGYFNYDSYPTVEKESPRLEMQKLLQQEDVSCTVCAKGALFAAKALNYNRCTLERFGAKIGAISNEEIRIALRGIFQKRQLDLIECAFEQSMMVFDDDLEAYHASKMYGDTSSERMRAICQNIIDNNGTFAVFKENK